MRCPFCGKQNTRVVDSRPGKIDFEVRRRRECLECLERFTTYERVEYIPIVIVKKDGRREEFNREKILTGIKKACEKRAISMDQIEDTVDTIEQDLRDLSEREIPSTIVGEKIIEALKKIDDVAYVRFASVYREFKDVADFIQELKSLMPDDCLPIEFDTITDKADDRS
ncbi:MAG: transcriptional regulator NrdR [Proteobacteria bacterium]|nr:transcriptional regulator NrdR [Pseudomonadota bacterium]MBU1389282.1 transcriptional regulator NrdR [Pseudomonadota bacterium]MBU1544102.1 transcriptional regulator NrdR [Pseudomonadota bacterium]MBU2481638.1 transcriptional regulator NrdR [Pseudomonadota bacterium]